MKLRGLLVVVLVLFLSSVHCRYCWIDEVKDGLVLEIGREYKEEDNCVLDGELENIEADFICRIYPPINSIFFNLKNLYKISKLVIVTNPSEGLQPEFAKLEHVRNLVFYTSEEKFNFPESLCSLTGVEELTLRSIFTDNIDPQFPEAIANLVNLRKLDLGPLVGINLPLEVVSKLKYLDTLVLVDSKLEVFPEEILCNLPSLRTLVIGEALKELPVSLFRRLNITINICGNTGLSKIIPFDSQIRRKVLIPRQIFTLGLDNPMVKYETTPPPGFQPMEIYRMCDGKLFRKT